MLNGFFKLEQHGASVRREVTAGATTFLTMAYVIFVNPATLSDAGMDPGGVFVAISVFRAREWIINAVPHSLKMGTVSGIGLFLGIIAMENAGLVVDNPATLVGLGDVGRWSIVLAALFICKFVWIG